MKINNWFGNNSRNNYIFRSGSYKTRQFKSTFNSIVWPLFWQRSACLCVLHSAIACISRSVCSSVQGSLCKNPYSFFSLLFKICFKINKNYRKMSFTFQWHTFYFIFQSFVGWRTSCF